MAVPWSRDIDDVDLRILDDGSPIGGHVRPAELLGCGLYRVGGSTAKRVHVHFDVEVEVAADLPVHVAVGFAHELVADQPNIKYSLCHFRSPGDC